jgi:hypothetical protein
VHARMGQRQVDCRYIIHTYITGRRQEDQDKNKKQASQEKWQET